MHRLQCYVCLLNDGRGGLQVELVGRHDGGRDGPAVMLTPPVCHPQVRPAPRGGHVRQHTGTRPRQIQDRRPVVRVSVHWRKYRIYSGTARPRLSEQPSAHLFGL